MMNISIFQQSSRKKKIQPSPYKYDACYLCLTTIKLKPLRNKSYLPIDKYFGKHIISLLNIAQEIGEKLCNLTIWKYMHYNYTK